MLELLKLLQDGRFHSGEALGATLGISRSAIWKQLQGLEAELGVEVFKVPGRGYRLSSPMTLLDAGQISHGADGVDWPVTVEPSVDSTNAEIFRRLDAGARAPFVLLAERQTAGRGRRGRVWASPFAENLYCSVVLRVDGGMSQVEALSLTVGLAVARALQGCGVDGARLKWPNDVLVDGRKISGILLELAGDPADVCHVVIGVGINVNMAVDAPAVIDQPWTSVRQCLGRTLDRNELAAELLLQLRDCLAIHWQHGFAGLREGWEALHAWRGRSVALTAGSNATLGVVLGVDERGAIRLSVDGVDRSFSGGELSLRLQHDS
ncbi:bifunctional biotin--[acetyl-CoA-carboxylase] ligase/biotin operon repressor BirA [Ectopseudomonas alcaliphila]|uniref:bifunctional biotin--[acetyl-CoA-carboxylase] ligase/biotin operon repressor BirA n=1 Tax=Ectopseudomonas alcaliphila TaxID=101564 RepID=UPI00278116D2|nr:MULTISPECIES: bifunctional biotin--[acetyl-CoA-carboxylase] ligase/biotin operon repressor BirA [Pseudomonas]MDP9942746.1 BirA family biotin operon repressor/biotin-[acetyl-CoA-carboxylase] ligase [Pseudomonas sp. 3400]MDR7014973.1 BirA family biotin operon repressor/biotin-[acetyl-CoA-carboxylase] ligase [Pseudomonas alcaliphila]